MSLIYWTKILRTGKFYSFCIVLECLEFENRSKCTFKGDGWNAVGIESVATRSTGPAKSIANCGSNEDFRGELVPDAAFHIKGGPGKFQVVNLVSELHVSCGYPGTLNPFSIKWSEATAIAIAEFSRGADPRVIVVSGEVHLGAGVIDHSISSR